MEPTAYYDDDEDGEKYLLPNDWIQRYIENVPPEYIADGANYPEKNKK